MRLLFALPGFHRYDRGAEVALLSVAEELARSGDDVTVVGSGEPRSDRAYAYRRLPSIRRERFERFPKLPLFRDETAWEDATFAAGVRARLDLSIFDATVTCSFPHTHWALRKKAKRGPAHFFVTQNGDWPAFANHSEYRFFGCTGLVCTNPDFYANNRERWNSALIPNGVDLGTFAPGPAQRASFGLPHDRPIVLMVSALIESKRVLDGIRAVAEVENAILVVAGDGPLRQEAAKLADQFLPGRFKRLVLRPEQMPDLYRSADVFLHMSKTESFGNVYLEALASGLPIVAEESDNLRWIVGSGQFLCDTSERRAVVQQIEAALRCSRLADQKDLQRFSWSSVAREYRAFIAETLALT